MPSVLVAWLRGFGGGVMVLVFFRLLWSAAAEAGVVAIDVDGETVGTNCTSCCPLVTS